MCNLDVGQLTPFEMFLHNLKPWISYNVNSQVTIHNDETSNFYLYPYLSTS